MRDGQESASEQRPSDALRVTRHGSRSVYITGASSGIGLALAREFAKRGYNLALAARRLDALDALKSELDSAGVAISTQALDVTRYDDVAPALRTASGRLGGLDIVIVNSGIGSLGRVGHGYFDSHRAIIETNVIGAMATSDAAVALFKQQGRGQLVLISSMAAFRGLPGSSAYGASKAALTTYGESIRAEIYGTNLCVTTIFPGFIDTPINQSNPSRPFLITPERGARIIADKIERRVQNAIVPAWPWAWLRWLVGFIPTAALARSRR